jgi:predicted site-specific integrase-resolvase
VNTPSEFKTEGRPILSLHKFCQQAGISDVTAWRWRKNGWLTTVNIAGRPYLTDRAMADFLRRAEAGEFAQEHKVPNRRMAL